MGRTKEDSPNDSRTDQQRGSRPEHIVGTRFRGGLGPIFAINLRAGFLNCREAVKWMRANGSIANLASITFHSGPANMTCDCHRRFMSGWAGCVCLDENSFRR